MKVSHILYTGKVVVSKCEVYKCERGTAVVHFLRCCATNRKVAGSITAGVIVSFH